MGLDMYLIGIKADQKEDIFEESTGIWEECAYWRKANQIHKWFSDRFIKKENPWGYYDVSLSEIKGLLSVCLILRDIHEGKINYKDVFKQFNFPEEKSEVFLFSEIDEKDFDIMMAQVLLPPDNIGCFFGSGIVDEFYWEQIYDTIDKLTKALKKNYDKFFYMASW